MPAGTFRSATERSEALGAEMAAAQIGVKSVFSHPAGRGTPLTAFPEHSIIKSVSNDTDWSACHVPFP